MNTETQFTEEQSGQKHRSRTVQPNKYLDPNDYSRYSLTPNFLSSGEEIIDCIECLENYHYGKDGESIITILTKTLSQNGDTGKELRLVKHILETGTDEVAGTQGFIIRPGLSIPIRQHWIDETFGNNMFELQTFIKAGLIEQHLSVEASTIREILSSGLRSYIKDTHFDYDTIETLLKHLQYIYQMVDEDELTEDEMSMYTGNIIERIDPVHPRFDSGLVGMIETTWEYYNIKKHIDLGPYMHGEKLENSDNAYNVIHRYLRLWHKEDTSQKDI